MEGKFYEGEFVSPDGERVQVAFSWGEWNCIVASKNGSHVIARRLTEEYWRLLRPAPER